MEGGGAGYAHHIVPINIFYIPASLYIDFFAGTEIIPSVMNAQIPSFENPIFLFQLHNPSKNLLHKTTQSPLDTTKNKLLTFSWKKSIELFTYLLTYLGT